jgi:hypothetical protein
MEVARWTMRQLQPAVFGIRPYLMESIKRMIKKKIYILFDESLIQQLKKKTELNLHFYEICCCQTPPIIFL